MWLTSIFKKKNKTAPDQGIKNVPVSAGVAAAGNSGVMRVVKGVHAPEKPAPEPFSNGIDRGVTNQIHYDAGLIEQLKAEHATLLSFYSAVTTMSVSGAWEKVPPILQEMRSAMYGHLLTEGVKLYAYMRRELSGDPLLYDIYRSYKKEMDVIGKVVFSFFDKYQGTDWIASAESRETFREEFATLGSVLTDRIRREEQTLYPLYSPISESAVDSSI